LFVVYAMIHPAGTMRDAFTPRIIEGGAFGMEGEIARGRAACEQRGSLASVFAALKAIGQYRGPRPEIQVLALTSGETGNHGAAACAIRDFGIHVDGTILAICSDMEVTIAHKGRVDVHITVEGKAAHSSSPALGVSAVAGARWALDRLDNIPLSGPHTALGSATLAVTRLSTDPIAAHTIPSRCLIELDLRLLPGDNPERQVDAIARALVGVPSGSLSVRAGNMMFPCELNKQSSLVQSVLRASRDAIGKPAPLRSMSAASDAGYFNLAGIPTVCYGAGAVARAHTDDDVVAMNDVIDIAAVYAELMRTGCKSH
jgi:acetylornithine deacetylase/succinyl-diaminopimelate desuccinylase-like protein